MNNPNFLGFDETKIHGHELTLEVLWKKTHLKVSRFQNEFMKSSFFPKYEPKIARISAL
jgi:hypothetical protein